MLLRAPAALQATRGQHLPSVASRWPRQVQYGETHLLLPVKSGKTGQDRGVPFPEGLQGYLPAETWVCRLRNFAH